MIKKMLRLCRLVGVFFSSFSTNIAQKSVYISFSHVYSFIEAFNWQHFIWEKRKQKHRLSMAQKKTTRYTQRVPYRRFYTIWFVKKSLTTSKHCCIHITVYDVSPLLSHNCSGMTTKAFLIQCCVYLICSSVSFVLQNLCRLFFIIFYRNSLHYSVRCYPFLVQHSIQFIMYYKRKHTESSLLLLHFHFRWVRFSDQ